MRVKWNYKIRKENDMKAYIKFDFANLFLYKEEIKEERITVHYDDLVEMEKGQEVEVLKIIKDPQYRGGEGYVIFNPENNESTTVARHFLVLESELEHEK